MKYPLHTLDWAVIVLYLMAMIAMGWVLSSRVRQFKDYFLAGGALTTPLLVCTLVSTYYELDVTFATSEMGFHYGLVSWTWLSRPYYICIFLAAILLTDRLKRYKAMTLPDIMEHHYGRGARVLSAIACFIYSLPITALAGLSMMFTILGWQPEWAMATSIGVCVLYTIMGGLWADVISDTIQFLLMCVSLAIAIPFAINWVGGWSFADRLPEEHWTSTGGLEWGYIVAYSMAALTVFVEPAFYQRIFAAKDSRAVKRSLIIGIFLWASYDWGASLLGMIGRAAVDSGLLDKDLEGKQALLAVCMANLPLGLKGLFLGGVLAAAMSSVDSYGLLASGNLVYDIYRPMARKPPSDRMMIRMTRIGIFFVMFVAVGASLVFARLADAWVFMAGVLASTVFVPVMGALFYRRPKPAAGLAAVGAGLLGLAIFHGVVHTLGVFDEDKETWKWVVGGVNLWREFAVLFALPLSAVGFALGQWLGRRTGVTVDEAGLSGQTSA